MLSLGTHLVTKQLKRDLTVCIFMFRHQQPLCRRVWQWFPELLLSDPTTEVAVALISTIVP